MQCLSNMPVQIQQQGLPGLLPSRSIPFQPIMTDSNTPAESRPDYLEEEERQIPRVPDLVSPRNILGWAWGFVDSWFHSRDYKLFLLATPFLIAGVGGAGFLWWLRTAPKNELVETYELAAVEASRNGDVEEQRIYLENLVRLRPNDPKYRFQLALHLAGNDQQQRAIPHFQMLTTPGRNDHAPARLWLVQQALTDTPLIPLTPEQIEGQLLMTLKLQPKNALAKRVMADTLVKKGQFAGAEDYLLDAVDDNPDLALPLAKVQRLLGRSKEQVGVQLETAIGFFEKQLMQQPNNPKVRLNLADAFVLDNKFEDAERALAEGLTSGESPELTRGLSNLYFGVAVTRLKESVLNRDLCVQLLLKAIKLTPGNKAFLNQAFALSAVGGRFPKGSLDQAVAALQSNESRTTDDDLLLVRALATNGELDMAIQTLEPLTVSKPELKIMLARLLKVTNRETDLAELLGELVADTSVDDRGNATLAERLKYSEVLILSSKFEESLELLDDSRSLVEDATEQESRRWNQLFGQSSIAVYDERLKTKQFKDFPEALKLLDGALKTNSVSMSVLERLVTLSCSDSDWSKSADEALNNMLANGAGNSDIYNLIGSRALETQQTAKAKRYLERAYRLSRKNPMVLNNLALALTRDSISDPERALGLAEDALKILPDHPDVLSTRAEVFIAMERWEDARHDLEVSLPSRPKSVNCHRLLAQVCDKMGDDSLAEKHRKLISELEASIVE